MTTVEVKVLDTASLQHMLHSRDGAVARTMLQRALLIEADAKRRVKADHGRLRQSITHEFVMLEGVPAVRIGTNIEYALDVHNGTGLHGPQHHRVVPVQARVMRFTSKSGDIVFARSTQGQEPNPYLKNALEAVMGRGALQF